MTGGWPAARLRGPVLSVALLATLAVVGCHQDDPGELEYAARVQFAAGHLEQAENRLMRLAKLRPLTVRERVLRAQIAQDRGRLDDAVAALEDPHGSEPRRGADAALLSAWRGWLEMARHRFRAAEAHLERAVSLEPGRAQARRQLIDLYALQGRADDVAGQATELARLETLEFAYLYAWALGQREGTDLAGQTAMLEDAVKADPDDRASRLALAECLRKLGRLQEADETLQGLPGNDPEARLIGARVALDRADVATAKALLGPAEEALAHPGLAKFRGQLAILTGDAESALEAFQAAAKALPESRDVQFGLGQALRLAGRPREAEPHLKAARDRDHLEWLIRGARPARARENPSTLQQIGAACLAMGRPSMARAWLQLALSHDPGNPEIQAAIERIKAEGQD